MSNLQIGRVFLVGTGNTIRNTVNKTRHAEIIKVNKKTVDIRFEGEKNNTRVKISEYLSHGGLPHLDLQANYGYAVFESELKYNEYLKILVLKKKFYQRLNSYATMLI